MRKPSARSPAKISAFWAQVITVRGLITVEMSPFMKALRVMSADADHGGDLALALGGLGVVGRLGQDDLRLHVVGQIVEGVTIDQRSIWP